MKTILCVPSDNGACGQYRIIQPYSKYSNDPIVSSSTSKSPFSTTQNGIRFLISRDLGDAWLSDNDRDMVDAVLIQRPEHELKLRFIKEFKAEGGLVVLESDDDIANVPYSNPIFHLHRQKDNEYVKIFKECVKRADHVHVSTPQLEYGKKSIVFYNAIDVEKYKEPLDRMFDVMWAGSPTHKDSLDLIKDVVEELIDNKIKVGLMSNERWLRSIFKPHQNLTIMDMIPFDAYYKIPSMAKIFLTPIPDNKFNRAKSEIKAIESAGWSVPSISSDVAPYRRFHELSGGANILVKKEKPKYWIQSIYQLLENEYLYEEKSRKSRAAVEQIYNLELINKQRSEWWSKIL